MDDFCCFQEEFNVCRQLQLQALPKIGESYVKSVVYRDVGRGEAGEVYASPHPRYWPRPYYSSPPPVFWPPLYYLPPKNFQTYRHSWYSLCTLINRQNDGSSGADMRCTRGAGIFQNFKGQSLKITKSLETLFKVKLTVRGHSITMWTR